MTIKDIAKLAGYSVSTVSRVLNNSPNVSSEAREKILDVVNEHSFIPNKNARQLKQQVSNTIAVIVKGTQNFLFAGILERMQQLFEEENYSATVFYLDEHANEVEHAHQLLRESKPIGLLFLGGNVSYFKESFGQIKVPSILVSTSASSVGFSNLSSTFTDDVAGGARAIEYLFEQGHEDIAVIGGDLQQSVISQLRFAGCQQAFLQKGLDFNSSAYATSRFSFRGGYRAMMELLEKSTEMTAVFAMSDVMAVGAVRALVDQGISVPEQVSVIGYDGTDLAHYYSPRLASIHQDQEQLARRSVSLLINMLQENSTHAIHETVPFQLIEGESVKPLNIGGKSL